MKIYFFYMDPYLLKESTELSEQGYEYGLLALNKYEEILKT